MTHSTQRDIHVYHKRPIHLVCTSALLALAALALLAACGIPGSAGVSTEAPIFSPIVQQSPVASSGQLIEQTITQFCNAVQASNYDQAYTYLSASYKQTVVSPSGIATISPHEKLLGCVEFGNGGFLKLNGNQAIDEMIYTVFREQSGAPAQPPGSMNLVQTGVAWQISLISISY
jgi:hypothetical protein